MRNTNFAELRCWGFPEAPGPWGSIRTVQLCLSAAICTKSYVYREMLRRSGTLVQIHCSNHWPAVAEEATAAERAVLSNLGWCLGVFSEIMITEKRNIASSYDYIYVICWCSLTHFNWIWDEKRVYSSCPDRFLSNLPGPKWKNNSFNRYTSRRGKLASKK